MKKIFTTLAYASLLVGCSNIIPKELIPPHFTEKDFWGKWYCTDKNDNLTQTVEEFLDIKSDIGYFVGFTTYLQDGYAFKYKAKGSFVVKIEGWNMVSQTKNIQVTRMHPISTKKALSTNPKLKKWEESLYSFLANADKNQYTQYRPIESFKPGEFITQTPGAFGGFAICLKTDKMPEHLK